jgi:tetratricopeptide (TPR) repeat protein
MKLHQQRSLQRIAVPALLASAWLLFAPPGAEAARAPVRSREEGGADATRAQTDYKAHDMLKRGTAFLEQKQEERGLKMLTSIPRMFPESQVRFQAHLTVGKHFAAKREYDKAIQQFRHVSAAEDDELRAEGLYQIGLCHYNMNSYDKAFVALRKVTNEYPGGVFANEAYYYIGQCHFKLGRWAKAVEALKMVGTSVGEEREPRLAEGGQRLFVKILDKDLVVLQAGVGKLVVEMETAGGDKERAEMGPLGRQGDYYIGSVQTAPGPAQPGDGVLQFRGLELVTISYLDENTSSGKRKVARHQQVKLVSTAAAGFTDGAYREYVKGVFADSDCFVRVKDLDRNATGQPDAVAVRILTRYELEDGEDERLGRGIDLDDTDEKTWQVRDTVQVRLVEDGPDTGVFVGSIAPKMAAGDDVVDQSDNVLLAAQGDEIVLEYRDGHHMRPEEDRLVEYRAKVLVGEIQDVKIIHRVVDSVDLKARKNLIEAKIYLRLGQIFKDVGLVAKAGEKADLGLERVERVISTSMKASLERETVEEAFMVKWELLLVKDKLNEAIRVCKTLTRLFPDSALVDRALIKIAQAKMKGENPAEAIPILTGILQLDSSDLKPEAQYSIAQVYEKMADSGKGRTDLSRALLAYQKCAEVYPDSAFAGESLEKIVNFYITAEDYGRAVELMERVFMDYPDASFLDAMLLKWVIASYRMGSYDTAYSKASQLLAEFPNSKYASKAQKFLEVIEKKL